MREYLQKDFHIEIGSETRIWRGDLVDQVFAAARWPTWVVGGEGYSHLSYIGRRSSYVVPITRMDYIEINCPTGWDRMPRDVQILRVVEELDDNAETARELLARACGGTPRSIADITFELAFRDRTATIPGRDLVDTPIDIVGRWVAVHYIGDGVGYLTKPPSESAEARLVPMLAPTIDRVRAEVNARSPRREEDLVLYARHRLLEVIEDRYDQRQRVDRSMWDNK
jgi:hypothetical protein